MFIPDQKPWFSRYYRSYLLNCNRELILNPSSNLPFQFPHISRINCFSKSSIRGLITSYFRYLNNWQGDISLCKVQSSSGQLVELNPNSLI